MKIKDLIIIDDNNKFILNWEIIESIKEFDKLKTTYQNPLWHSEGDVWTHTLYVATNALYSGEDRDFNNKDFVLFVMGALFHDIGKGACTVFNHERNTWSSREHAEIGSQMIKNILNEEDIDNVKVIEFYVKNHMLPLEINESNFTDTIEMLKNEIDNSKKYFKRLIDLKRCDCLGSIMRKDDMWDEKLQKLYSMYNLN